MPRLAGRDAQSQWCAAYRRNDARGDRKTSCAALCQSIATGICAAILRRVPTARFRVGARVAFSAVATISRSSAMAPVEHKAGGEKSSRVKVPRACLMLTLFCAGWAVCSAWLLRCMWACMVDQPMRRSRLFILPLRSLWASSALLSGCGQWRTISARAQDVRSGSSLGWHPRQ